MDDLRLKYLDFLYSSLVNVGKILRHQLFAIFIFTIFFLYVAFIHKSSEPLSIPFIDMQIQVKEIIIYCPLILGYSCMSFCLFQFYRKALYVKMVNQFEHLGLEKQPSANKELNYIIYPTVMDVINVVRESSLRRSTKSIFYIASYAQTILVYCGPLIAQGFLVSKALELVPSQNIVLKALLYSSFVLPLLGLMVITEEGQHRFFEYVDNIGERIFKSITVTTFGKIALSLVALALTIRCYLFYERVHFIIVGITVLAQALRMIFIQIHTISTRRSK